MPTLPAGILRLAALRVSVAPVQNPSGPFRSSIGLKGPAPTIERSRKNTGVHFLESPIFADSPD